MKPVEQCRNDLRKLAQQTLEQIDDALISASAAETILNEVDTLLKSPPEHLSPAELGYEVFKLIQEKTGIDDPCQEQRGNRGALAHQLLPYLQQQVKQSFDPIQTAALVAAVGSGFPWSSCDDLQQETDRLLQQGLARSDFDRFREELKDVYSLLYLPASAGEIVFDRVFIEALKAEQPELEITVAVHQLPLLGNALKEDAIGAGLEAFADIIDKGYDGAGTQLSQGGDEFQLAFSTSDIIISKGLANYETLLERPDIIYFVLQAGCKPAADALRVEEGQRVFVRSY